jgi:autotransporter-associated beta strand protein
MTRKVTDFSRENKGAGMRFQPCAGPAAVALTLLFGVWAQAATLYWDGTGTNWGPAESWSTVSEAATPDPGAAPGAADLAVFSVDGVSGLQAVALDADQAAAQLSVRGSATGGVVLTGSGAVRTLNLGTGGLEILEGAGPVVLGSAAAGQSVALSLAGNQTWTNGSANSVVIQNGIGASGAHTLTLRGAGGFRLNGPGTFSGGTTLSSSTVGIGDDTALGTGTFTLNTGTILVEDFPRTLANKVKVNGGTTYWSGDGALTLTGSGATPAFAITRYAAPNIYIVNTAPLTISGIYSLCDATAPNNNPQSPTLASGADLTISADIREYNTGSSYSTDNKGAKFVFTGTGANLTLSGTNGFGEGASIGRSTDIVAQPGSGFNTITVGGPGGPGAVITPFGLSALYSNNGQGFYLKALENGQTLSNSLSFGNSVGNDGGRPLGFTGANDLTLGGRLTLSVSMTLPNLASGTLTFAGTVNCVTSRTLTVLGPGATVFGPTSVLTGIPNLWGGIAKLGSGTLTLAGTSDLLGATTLRGGSAILDYSASDASRLTAGTNTAAALVLGGVDLQLKGGSYSQTLGAGGGTTLDVGHSRVRRTNGGTSTLALGAITRNSGGLIDFESGVASTTSGNTSGLLGNGYATVDGTDWATVSGGAIVAYAGYGTFAAPDTDQNVAHTGNTTIASTTIRTLKLATSGPGESLTQTSGNLSLNGGGLLFVGADDYTIGGSSIAYSGGLCVHHHGGGTLTINSRLSGGIVQKAGPGQLVLTCVTNNYTTMTYLLGGTVSVHADGCLGTGNLSFNGGTLQTTAGFTTAKPVTLYANGGTFHVDADTLELTGRITASSYGALNKTGAGTLLLAASNHFAGPVTVSEGTLKLGHLMALGPLNNAASASDRSISPVTVTGAGVLDLAGFSPSIGNFTLTSGTVTDSAGGGTLGAYSFTLESGTVEAVLTNVVMPYAQNPSNRNNLYKRGAGEAVIASACTYSGHTFVDGGTLRVNGTLPASAVLVRAGGTLGGTGTVQRTVNVEGGTLAPGAGASLPGTMTLGGHLRVDGEGASSGKIKIEIGAAGYGQLVLTNTDAKVLLADAELSLSLLPGAALGTPLTIIDNQGEKPVQGSFSGLPEGSTFEAVGRRFTITYQGGDGNDIVLTARSSGTIFTIH